MTSVVQLIQHGERKKCHEPLQTFAGETFETNAEFKRYFHRAYKPQQKLTGGGKQNPDLALSEILDTLIEWLELGMPIVK